ncbi:hypothetical protein Plhal304r1_c043g0122851 [Plasmopara halstedii]
MFCTTIDEYTVEIGFRIAILWPGQLGYQMIERRRCVRQFRCIISHPQSIAHTTRSFKRMARGITILM